MYKRFLKRFIDFLVGVIGLPFFCLAFVFIAPIIFFTDRGPIFYNGERIGLNGRKFPMYKFRSMKVNSPDIRNEDGSTFNSENDFRVTKVGRILRKTSLDEIPQILNVIKGDMSIIGPRPNLYTVPIEQLSEVEQRRLTVRPGITGYNQAYYRNSISTEEKYKNDLFYIDNLSISLDLKIFLKTISTVLKQENINSSKEQL